MEKRQTVFKGKIETIGIVEVKKHFRIIRTLIILEENNLDFIQKNISDILTLTKSFLYICTPK